MYGVKKQISWILFGIILLTSFSLVFSFNVNAEEETSSIIYIKSDGSVDPSTAPIKVCGNRYYITADITGAIYVEKSGIVIFGRSNELSAPEDDDEDNYGVYIKDQSSVYLFDLEITGFDTYGVYLLHHHWRLCCYFHHQDQYMCPNSYPYHIHRPRYWLLYQGILYTSGMNCNTFDCHHNHDVGKCTRLRTLHRYQ